MFRSSVCGIATAVLLASVGASPALADQTPAAPGSQARPAGTQKPTPAPAKPAAEPTGDPSAIPAARGPAQSINIRLELTITDQRATGAPASKTISMLIADKNSGRIRTSGDVKVGTNFRTITLNVDAQPEVLRDGRLRVQCNLEYRAQLGQGSQEENQPTSVYEQFNVILEDGKQTVVTQSADPASDRRVQVELKATLVK